MDDDRLAARLQALREEFEAGERQLAEIDRQRAQLVETMLRISGAIQVLQELAEQPPEEPQPGSPAETSRPLAEPAPADAPQAVPPAAA